MLGNVSLSYVWESINAVEFFENLWGFIPYWGTNEGDFVLSSVSFFEKDKAISDNYFFFLNCLKKLIQ